MIATAWKSKSTVAVFNADDKSLNFNADIPLLRGHDGNILDMSWSPFNDKLLATCAEDRNPKFWLFDDYNGLMGGQNRTDYAFEL